MSSTVAVPNVLAKILEHKRGEIAAAKLRRPVEQLQTELACAPPVRDFVAALRAAPDLGLIAEVKKKSPSVGLIRADFDPIEIARVYQSAGASCLSVLTDEEFFGGRIEYLKGICETASVPLLRKDFIVDRYQVLEARVAGADCVLLIAECLDDCTLRDLYFYASELGMDALIEIYDPENLDRVLKLDPPLVGVNNRDLRSFVVDLDHTLQIVPRVPKSTLLVSESGIKTRADVEKLKAHGVGAILVGETLMRAADIGAAVRDLVHNQS